MSRDIGRKDYYNRDRNWDAYRRYEKPTRKRSRSPLREQDKRRSRSPRKPDKDIIDDNILSEISKLPEPSELWDNQFQQDNNYSAPASNFSQDSTFNHNYQPSYSGQYDEFQSSGPAGPPPASSEMASWNQMSLPPPPPPQQVYNVEDQIKKEAAIETEMRHQKAALSKQREDYIKKGGILKKELDTLKDQRNELRGDSKRSPSPDTKRFLKENTKLQLEIQNKLKTINNVVDMLNGIIGEEAVEIPVSDDSPDRGSKRKSRSPSNKKFNYVYYDPEMHWCRVCNEFPPTAKDYLNHLHSAAHHKNAAAHMEAPWHSVTGVNEGFQTFPSAPTKRTPIKGLQFFVPSTAWYCKLCDQFIGDLHCASAHLKSVVHAKNYTNFVEQNPHWETDWMSDRQKAFEKTRGGNKKIKAEDKCHAYTAHTITFNKDGFHTKTKSPPKEEEKKKKEKKKKSKRKRNSSTSSSSSSSDSDSEPVKKKKSKKSKKLKFDAHDPRVQELVSSLSERRRADRNHFNALASRIKLGQLEDTRRHAPDRGRERTTSDRRDSIRRSRSADRRQTDNRHRDERRDDRREERREDRREEKREEKRREEKQEERRDSPPPDVKKPEIRKMPFIGKMPVYKHLGKSKTEEQKKEEEKKKEDGEALKKRQQEIDAEIQKKVAEFKEKIAKSQLEREQEQQQQRLVGGLLPGAFLLAPPAPPAPTAAAPQASAPAPAPAVPLALPQPPPAATPLPPGTQPPVSLPKDFQDALDIIFPSEVKQEMGQQDMFQGLQGIPGFPGLSLGGVMPQFPQLSLLGQPPMMVPFDINSPLFPRPQLYDAHVPMLSAKRNQKSARQNQKQHSQNQQNQSQKPMEEKESPVEKKTERNKAELDELALLGIDASDVGAGM
ncbi:protein MLP1 homolog [Zerene cesonia]|uniref:protein MLP1 homolog n=1 Tax=Zerene cesonia TaxID=33412 RepID=UPI0018E4E857|nr:protein MLP1 homolog [Zerene cesonia]